MTIAFRQTDDSSEIRLEGVVDISSAAELKSMFLAAIAAGNSIAISAGQVTELDAAAFQLLLAAQQEAKRHNLDFRLSSDFPEPVQASLAAAGLSRLLNPL